MIKRNMVAHGEHDISGTLFVNRNMYISCSIPPTTKEREIEHIVKYYSFPDRDRNTVTVTPLPGKETEVRKWVALCNLMGCKDEIKILPDEGGEDAEK